MNLILVIYRPEIVTGIVTKMEFFQIRPARMPQVPNRRRTTEESRIC
jgi:hypothetical protein